MPKLGGENWKPKREVGDGVRKTRDKIGWVGGSVGARDTSAVVGGSIGLTPRFSLIVPKGSE